MGFQLVKREIVKPSSSSKSSAKRTQDNIATLQRLGCKGCPLDKETNIRSPKMEPDAGDETLVMFLGEAPGANEDTENCPFVGVSGQMLRGLVPDEFKDEVAYNNTVQCRPPNNRTPIWQEVTCCRPRVIQQVETLKPKLIIGVGAVSLDWAIGNKDLKGMRGRLFAIRIGIHSCWFMPVYHPSFILRIAFDKKKPLQSKFGHSLKMDLNHAFEALEKLPDAVTHTIKEANEGIELLPSKDPKSFRKIKDHFIEIRRSKKAVIDYESTGLDPHAEDNVILTFSITYKNITFATDLDHQDSKWTKDQRKEILSGLENILRNKKIIKVAHNAPNEMGWSILYFGEDVIWGSKWEDTMVQAYVLDERKGEKYAGSEMQRQYQSLDFLTLLWFGINIKGLSNINYKDMRSNSIEDLLPYNGRDTKYTNLLNQVQAVEIKRQGLTKLYNNIQLPRLQAVASMTHYGIPTDQDNVNKFQTQLGKKIIRTEKKINKMKVIKDYKSEHRDKYNPLSNKDVMTVFKDYLKRPEIKVPKKYPRQGEDKFRYSVDSSVLEQIEHPLAKQTLELRRITKLKSTYCDDFELNKGTRISPDGYLHPTFNTTFTTTGRLSAWIQNWPKNRDIWVRGIVGTPKGYIFIAADYSQVEACAAAMCSKDKYLTEAIWDRYDIHMEWAEKIAHKYPRIIGGKKFMKDADVMKKLRQKAKNKMVFPSIFGATVNSVAGYMDMPDDIIKELMDEFWKTFFGLKNWQDKLMKDYYNKGWVATLTGRHRRYPLTRNEAINEPIQGSASDITVNSMERLCRRAIETGNMNIHPRMNIHDDLTSMCRDKNNVLEDSIDIILKEMLDVPFDWINVPLGVEVEIGTHWDDMQTIGKFYSDTDL